MNDKQNKNFDDEYEVNFDDFMVIDEDCGSSSESELNDEKPTEIDDLNAPSGSTPLSMPKNSKLKKDWVNHGTPFKMALIHKYHPLKVLTWKQSNIILQRLLVAIDETPEGSPYVPQFTDARFILGVLLITCAKESAKTWLTNAVKNMEPVNNVVGKIEIVEAKAIPNRKKFRVWIPENEEENAVRMRLSTQNKALHVSEWVTIRKGVGGRGQTFVFGIDQRSVLELEKNHNHAYYKLTKITFKPLGAGLQNKMSEKEFISRN